jgi:hypothetical protein
MTAAASSRRGRSALRGDGAIRAVHRHHVWRSPVAPTWSRGGRARAPSRSQLPVERTRRQLPIETSASPVVCAVLPPLHDPRCVRRATPDVEARESPCKRHRPACIAPHQSGLDLPRPRETMGDNGAREHGAGPPRRRDRREHVAPTRRPNVAARAAGGRERGTRGRRCGTGGQGCGARLAMSITPREARRRRRGGATPARAACERRSATR